jgi:dihydroorotase-like cyclic amidohydrolase
MNPPLRSRACQEMLLGKVLAAPVDFFVGSDHAPHPVAAKDRLDPDPASGIPAIPFWPKGIKLLRDRGLDEDALRHVTFGHANVLFGLGLEGSEVDTIYKISAWIRYGWNPFERLGA